MSLGDNDVIRSLIEQYVDSINGDTNGTDLNLAEKIWLTSPDASFIHPRGHEIGWGQIRDYFYIQTMGEMFTARKLVPRDINVSVFTNAAYAEFYWTFDATFRQNGSALHTEGRESQMYVRDGGEWRLVKVHYSSMPVTGEGEGF